MGADDTVSVLERIVERRGRAPKLIRCDNGPEFISQSAAQSSTRPPTGQRVRLDIPQLGLLHFRCTISSAAAGFEGTPGGGVETNPKIVESRLAELTFQPLTNAATGCLLYELVLMAAVEDVVEFGFAHGTSTAYMAAALEEKGCGCVRTFDREDAREREPNLFEVLAYLGLEPWVKPTLSASSYTWELMRILDQRTADGVGAPCFDFCFLDGAHTWETDGLAFLLVDRLLREDRWIVFDDLNWTLGSSPTLKETDRVRAMPDDERSTPHVRKVIDLLVRPLGYDLRFVGNLALAYKPALDGNSERHRHDFEELVVSHPALVRELALGSPRSRLQKPRTR